jgi:hypothetical protein
MAVSDLHFYCDESSHRGHRFAAVSGIVANQTRIATINQELSALKVVHGKSPLSELKWEKTNRHDLPLYKAYCNYLFLLLEANYAHYHVVICDFQAYDHRALNEGDKSRSVSKTYYQLLLHRCCKLYGEHARIHVRADNGDCTRSLPSYQDALNIDARKRFRLIGRPIASINLIDSNGLEIMQMNDVVLGAIASHRNGRHLIPGASPHKTELAEHVRKLFGVTSFAFNTPRGSRRNSIWNWQGQLKTKGATSPR